MEGVADPATPDLQASLEDWVTIWQSELAGLVLDREVRDLLLRGVDTWAEQSRAMLRMMEPASPRDSHDTRCTTGPGTASPGSAGTDAAPGAAAIAVASDERDRVIARLLDRVADLERRHGERPTPPAGV